jgi:hypothetical protein
MAAIPNPEIVRIIPCVKSWIFREGVWYYKIPRPRPSCPELDLVLDLSRKKKGWSELAPRPFPMGAD